MTDNSPPCQLPVVLPSHRDELLSSWIIRHAVFYHVPPLVMLRHCLPEVASMRTVDIHLNSDQEIRLANMFAVEPALVYRMTFANVAQSSRRLIAAKPVHRCANCSSADLESAPILRSHLMGWRITCPLCGSWLRAVVGDHVPSPFRQYVGAALQGEKLLDDEAERGIRTWTSPAEIARLLLMRRIPRPIPHEHDLWRFRVLGAIILELDNILIAENERLPTAAIPILPLHLRPALLAGIAIVERAGPEMLRMLKGHMMGQNRTRFSDAVEAMVTPSRRPPPQMHLI